MKLYEFVGSFSEFNAIHLVRNKFNVHVLKSLVDLQESEIPLTVNIPDLIG